MKGQALKKVEYSLPLLLASMQRFHLLDCDSVVDCLMLNFVTNLDLTPHLLPNLEINYNVTRQSKQCKTLRGLLNPWYLGSSGGPQRDLGKSNDALMMH